MKRLLSLSLALLVTAFMALPAMAETDGGNHGEQARQNRQQVEHSLPVQTRTLTKKSRLAGFASAAINAAVNRNMPEVIGSKAADIDPLLMKWIMWWAISVVLSILGYVFVFLSIPVLPWVLYVLAFAAGILATVYFIKWLIEILQ